MDLENLKELKLKAKGLTILFVEDAKPLQHQVKKFLDKFFLNVYQAYDGEDGLRQYKLYEPDIVISDLTMPKKDGISMIREIKHFHEKAKIIILSAHNDEEVLMNIIKLNVIEFLMKPLDIDKLIDILLINLGSEKLNEYEQCLHDLNIIFQQKSHLNFVNYFKDYTLEQEGYIVSVDDGVFKVKIPHTQILAIDYEQNTVMELKAIDKFMKLKLLDIDKENDLIYLTQPIYIDYVLKDITNKHYFYDKNFEVGIHSEHEFMNLDVLDISFDTIIMFSEEIDIPLDITSHINITISLDGSEIYSRGKVISIESYSGGLKIISTLDIEQKDRLNFKNYLHKIEDEIIKDLTKL
ncbi:MAG: response regulator [Campylobacterota bacterium]|nr:response regulator [Campylobacterota bacterium]